MSQAIKKRLSVKGHQLNYELRYRDQKRIVLRIREGQIFISAPNGIEDWQIEQAIYRHYSKIVAVQENYENQAKYELFGNQKWIKLFDKEVPISLSPTRIHAKMVDETLCMTDYYDQDLQLTKIYAFLSQYYKNWFNKRTEEWAQKIGVNYKNLSMRVMNLKWGVCYPDSQKIIFNPKLLHFEAPVIDYVIVHELTHLNHPNHSTLFWRDVEKWLPNYRELKLALDKSGL